MKQLYRICVVGMFLCAMAGIAHGQSLSQVLCAVQKRRQLQIDQIVITGSLNNVDHTASTLPVGDPPSLIDWSISSGSLSGTNAYPTESDVNGLPVEQQIALLKQAWIESYWVGDDNFESIKQALGGPVSIDNFSAALQLLAARLKKDTGIAWPVLFYNQSTATLSGTAATASKPIPFNAADISSTTAPGSVDNLGQVATQFSPALRYVDYCGTATGSSTSPASYGWSASAKFFNHASILSSPSYSGTLSVSVNSDFKINYIDGILAASGSYVEGTNAFYCPGDHPWQNISIAANSGSTTIDSLAPPQGSSNLKFPGNWGLTDGLGLDVPPVYYFPDTSEHSKQTAVPVGVSLDKNEGLLPGFNCTFHANFGNEFPAPAPMPEAMPPLAIVPNFEYSRLEVHLAGDPANDCVLYWTTGTDPTKGIAYRHSLGVRGYGQYDAVYSGSPVDREPEYVWPKSGSYPYVGTDLRSKRWSSFGGATGTYQGSYLDEWWRPVLKQLKTATYGINIIELPDSGGDPAKSSYQIDFYRADQLGSKTSGTYDISGSAIDSWIVSNPAQDDTAWRQLKIATSGSTAIYALTGTNVMSGSDVAGYGWNFTGSGSSGTFYAEDWARTTGTVNLPAGTLLTTGSTISAYNIAVIQTTDSVTMDGQPLPKVTKDYWGAPSWPLLVTVDGGTSDGMQTTTYAYTWVPDGSGHPSDVVHLAGITQTGSVNAFTAAYDAQELLTDYSSGPNEVKIAYSGSNGNVTRTNLFNTGTTSGTINVMTTTYSDGMATGSSSVAGVSTAAPAMTLYYSGTDAVAPWMPKAERGFDGTLTTYAYGQAGGTFTGTIDMGREEGSGTGTWTGTVANGTRTVTKMNPAGRVVEYNITDIKSGALLDSGTATAFQNSVFPSQFSHPLGVTESYGYDAQGRITSHTDALGKTTLTTLDALGRPVTITENSLSGSLTNTILYNSGSLGYKINTVGSSGTQTTSFSSSPFGATQVQTAYGPDAITGTSTVTRTETTDGITTTTVDGVTQQTITGTTHKADLCTHISGNATQPWTISYAPASGGGLKKTVTHGTDTDLTTSMVTDPLGRTITVNSPNLGGTGSVSTSYGYAYGQLASGTDPKGTTSYAYHPDGSLAEVNRGGRYVKVGRTVSNSTQIALTATNAVGDVFNTSYNPATQATTDTPFGLDAQAVTTTPTISGSVFSMAVSGPDGSATASWNGAKLQYSGTDTGVMTSGSITTNDFSDVTQSVMNLGGTSAVTTNYSATGLPTTTSGPGYSGSFTGTFDATTGFSGTYTASTGKTQSGTISPEGNVTGLGGYGETSQAISEPVFSGTEITQSVVTSAGTCQFTMNLAGEVTHRTFADGSSESYSYDENGAMKSWTNARNTTFDFAPNQFAEPTTLGTMAAFGYNDAGQINATVDASGTQAISYVQGQPANINYTGGPLAGQYVKRQYDSLGRLIEIDLPGIQSTGKVVIKYRYNGTTKQLAGVTTAAKESGTWSNFDAVTGRAKSFAMGPLTVTGTFDGLGRITSQASVASSGTDAYTGYTYDGDGHCTSRVTPSGTWTYGYNTYGYLSSGSLSGTAGINLHYYFDEAGRPLTSGTATFGASDYNPTTRTNAQTVIIFGSVDPSATLKVNGVGVTVDGTTGKYSVTYTPTQNTWQTYTITGSIAASGTVSAAVATETRRVFVPPASETLTSDTSGNRNGDSRWTFTWDDLDRLTAITESGTGVTSPRQIDCVYDIEGRRVKKTVISGTTVTKVTTILWDGWHPVMEVDKNGGGTITSQRYYTWGADVSGSRDEKAGIGGLVEIMERKGPALTVSVPIYDGIGNITGLVDATTGQKVASYTYGPFGEVLDASGPRARSCPFRFQTKMYDSETGYYYFGKRYYDPTTRTWLSRDPIREDGGVNLYAYCNDDPVGNYDAVGLAIEDHFSPSVQKLLGLMPQSSGISMVLYQLNIAQTSSAAAKLDLQTGGSIPSAFVVMETMYAGKTSGIIGLREAWDHQLMTTDAHDNLVIQDLSSSQAKLHGLFSALQLFGPLLGELPGFRGLKIGGIKADAPSVPDTTINLNGDFPSSSAPAQPSVSPDPPVPASADAARVEVNSRLLNKLEAYNAYTAKGGRMNLTQWHRATIRRFGGDGGVYNSGFAEWFRQTNGKIHGNSLFAKGPHDVYAIREARTGRILHFGETGRGYLTRFEEHFDAFSKLGIDVDVDLLETVEGKAAARALEKRFINIYMKIFGKRPLFNPVNH